VSARACPRAAGRLPEAQQNQNACSFRRATGARTARAHERFQQQNSQQGKGIRGGDSCPPARKKDPLIVEGIPV